MIVLSLLAASAWGAQLQLSLPLSPAPSAAGLQAAPIAAHGSRFEAIEAISAIPGLPAAAALPAAQMPAEVARALKAGDAHAFYQAAADTGYEPPAGDDHQQRLIDEGAARAQAEDAFYDAVAPRRAKSGRGKLDYAAFGRALSRYPGLSEKVFEHASAKRAILRAAGYTHLYGPKRERPTLEQASDRRVGEVFAKTLRVYRNAPR